MLNRPLYSVIHDKTIIIVFLFFLSLKRGFGSVFPAQSRLPDACNHLLVLAPV